MSPLRHLGAHLHRVMSPLRHLGTHLHRVMSIRLGLASITRENVIEATGARGPLQVFLYATFEGVGAWCQTAALKQSTAASLCGRAHGPLGVSVSPPALGVCLQDCAGGQEAWPGEERT